MPAARDDSATGLEAFEVPGEGGVAGEASARGAMPEMKGEALMNVNEAFARELRTIELSV